MTEKYTIKLNDWMTEPLRDVMIKAVEMNMALNKFNKIGLDADSQLYEMCDDLIECGFRGLDKIKKIENVEVLNAIIYKVGLKEWGKLCQTLAFISEILQDERILIDDAKLTKRKQEARV